MIPLGVLQQQSLGGGGGGNAFIEGAETVQGVLTGTTLTLTFSDLGDATQCIPLYSSILTAKLGFDYGNKTTCAIDVFDDAGTVKATITRSTDAAADIDINLTLVEFKSKMEVTKTYRSGGTWNTITGILDTTVPAVNFGSAFVVVTHQGMNTGNAMAHASNVCAEIIDSTTVRMRNAMNNQTHIHSYIYTVSDPDGDMTVNYTSLSGTYNDITDIIDLTFPSVDMSKTLILGGASPKAASLYPVRHTASAELLNSTTIRFKINSDYSGVQHVHFNVQTVTFDEGVILQQGYHNWASGDRIEDKTITGVADLTKSIALSSMPYSVFNSSDSAGFVVGNFSFCQNKVSLIDETTIRVAKLDQSGSTVGAIGYQVLEWT
jgi:hypothetical protein